MPNLVSVSSNWELKSTIWIWFKYQKMGKGKIMSKEKLSDLERVIVKLQKIREDKNSSESNRAFAASLLGHYAEYKTLTHKQLIAARNTIKFSKPKRTTRKPQDKTYYLYAMQAGDKIKIGVTHSIKKRKASLQTGNPEKITCIWSYPCGKSKIDAFNQEKKLHRACKKHRLIGEWFDYYCLPIVKDFKVR